MKSFIKVAHWQGYISHIEKDYFVADVKWIPLDKKKARLKLEQSEDGIVQFKKSEIPLKDQDKIQLGQLFDWYLGYTSTSALKKGRIGDWYLGYTFKKRRIDLSLIEFFKKYGKNGKRINMREVERKAKELYEKLNWS